MATTDRTAESGAMPEPTRAAIGREFAAPSGASRRGRSWSGERWSVPLVALAVAGVLAGGTAFGGLAVSSARLAPPPPATAISAPVPMGTDPDTSATWDERLCCRETPR